MRTKAKKQVVKPVVKPQVEKRMKAAAVKAEDAQYADAMASIGSVLICADALGVSPMTISRRVNGVTPLTKEMWLAVAAVKAGLVTEVVKSGEGTGPTQSESA